MADIPASAITGATLNSIQNAVIENRTHTEQALNVLPVSPVKSIQRGKTTLGMNVHSLEVTIQEVNPNKAVVNLISYRNDHYPDYQGEMSLQNSTTLLFSNPGTGYKINSMRYSWEVIEYV